MAMIEGVMDLVVEIVMEWTYTWVPIGRTHGEFVEVKVVYV
jgi:hypothetical protein